jgi:acetyltransferase-like isoleucine patch superfamily enzyme
MSKHKFLLLYSWFIKTITVILPDQPSIMRFRGWLYSFGLSSCGINFQVSSSTVIRNLENITVGQNVYLAPNVVLNAIGSVLLDDEVMVGFNSVIVSGNHTRINGSFRFGKSKTSPIHISKGVWIAANCTITAGTRIGEGILIASNSSVSGVFLDCKMIGGVPAKQIK